MSRTTHDIRGTKYPAKTRRKIGKTKFFGYTDGVHSRFVGDALPGVDEDRNIHLDIVAEFTQTSIPKEVVRRSYPIKGVDYVKDGYGNGIRRENRSKHYKKEIE